MIRCGGSAAAEIQYREIADATGGRYIDFADVDGARGLATVIEAALVDATGGSARALIERRARELNTGDGVARALKQAFQLKEGSSEQ